MTVPHAGEIFNAHELLSAMVADRLERMVSLMVERDLSSFAILGSRRHNDWLYDNIQGMKHLPAQCYISWGDPMLPVGSEYRGAPVLHIDDQRIHDSIECVLIGDDRHESKLYDIACRQLPPAILLWRLYERLPIGREPLPATHDAVIEPKPSERMTQPGIAYLNRIENLIAATALPI